MIFSWPQFSMRQIKSKPKNKRPGKPLPGVRPTSRKSALGPLCYLLVLGAAGAAGAAFVSGAFEVVSPWLQPVSTAPMTIPNSTISVNILFISS